MKKILLYIMVLVLLPVCSWAACTAGVADTPSYADVAECISESTHEDTITIPAGDGTETWSSTLTIIKAITITGPGSGNLIITATNGDAIIYAPDPTTVTNDYLFTLTGFTFDGNSTAGKILDLNNVDVDDVVRVKIHANKFQNGGSAFAIRANGPIRGVIYSNTFDRIGYLFQALGDSQGSWDNFAILTYGSDESIFFEDNTVAYSSDFPSSDPAWIETSLGGRMVFRYNSIDYDNTTDENHQGFDVHGAQDWPEQEKFAGMGVEMYHNTWANAVNLSQWVNHRGGPGIYFNNTGSGNGNYIIDIDQRATGCDEATGYLMEVQDVHIWNNLVNGSREDPASTDNCGATEDVAYWLEKTGFNGTTGIGMGLAATMAGIGTCTENTAFWVTDEGNWADGGDDDGLLYKCDNSDTWVLYYTPYTYPHPLRQEGSCVTTGTVIGDDEDDISGGGSTIILTLTGDLWPVAADGLFDAQRANIASGIDSAQSEGTGWDAVVKAGIDVDDVVRTSDSVVTITLDTEAGYDITANELITPVICDTCTLGLVEITSSSFGIDAVGEEGISSVPSGGYHTNAPSSGYHVNAPSGGAL